MPNELIPVRLSHVLGQSGVGAIVRGANGLVVVQDIRHWTDRQGEPAGTQLYYVDRARQALEITQHLREPPVAKEVENGQIDGVCVPATRFPGWMRCPNSNCGALYQRPWMGDGIQDLTDCRCQREKCKNKPKLEQVTWVLAHEAGYLADVPWHFLAHRHSSKAEQQQCKRYDQLQLVDRGYEQRTLRCASCGASSQFKDGERLPFGQQRMQPWTTNDFVPPVTSTSQEDETGGQNVGEVLAVNDSRLYSTILGTALIIPPESRINRGSVVDRLYRNSDERKKLDKAREGLPKKQAKKALATKLRCSLNDIDIALMDLDRGYPLYGQTFTPGQLKESEFEALLEVMQNQLDNEDLVTRNLSRDWKAIADAESQGKEIAEIVSSISNLVRVDRLKKVQIFKGFTRLGGKKCVPPNVVGDADWLPAIELYGEGVFFILGEQKLQKWEDQPAVLERLEKLQRRFVQAGRPDDSNNPLTSRFMLLHTLSHLMMRQIEAEGGYPAASLIERIYCSKKSSHSKPMAGILIHVAVPDIAGSLGGLAELAEPKKFLGILSRALEHARWCSLDPVCSEHDGQGPGLLNRAACHACTLVPEPACEYGNTLLDRGFIKGDEKDGLPAFFGAN